MLEEPGESWPPLCIPSSLTLQNCIFFPNRARNNLWEISTQQRSVSHPENVPTFTHTADMRKQLRADSRVRAMGSLDYMAFTDAPLFTLRFCGLSILSSYISMIYKRYCQNHLMWFFHFVLIYYLLFTVSSPITTVEFPSLLIWPVSILSVYFNFLFFFGLQPPHDSPLFISLHVCVSIIYQHVHSEELCSLIVKVLFPSSQWVCVSALCI